MNAVARCFGDGDPMMEAYHDTEWGRPVRSERGLFEKVCLEGFQAGLSWRTILARREQLRAAFDDFDPEICAGYDEASLEAAMLAPGMLRNRSKIRSVATNARATVGLREGGGLTALIWSHRPTVQAVPLTSADVPGSTDASAELAKALRRSGFSFVGPTTAYALMQADGLVNDHLRDCPVRAEVEVERSAAQPVPAAPAAASATPPA